MDRPAFEERGRWAAYNASQAGRPPRRLAERLVGLAGEGDGRLALDLGYGAGRDAVHLLDHGWRLLAIDGDETAGDLFGERASSTAEAGIAHVDEAGARALFAGLDVLDWVEEERDGESFTGPHHWHVFSVVARRPSA